MTFPPRRQLEARLGLFGVTLIFLGLRSSIYRFCRLDWGHVRHFYQLHHAISYLTILQFWPIDFLGTNKIGLAEQNCCLAQPPLEFDCFASYESTTCFIQSTNYLIPRVLCFFKDCHYRQKVKTSLLLVHKTCTVIKALRPR